MPKTVPYDKKKIHLNNCYITEWHKYAVKYYSELLGTSQSNFIQGALSGFIKRRTR